MFIQKEDFYPKVILLIPGNVFCYTQAFFGTSFFRLADRQAPIDAKN